MSLSIRKSLEEQGTKSSLIFRILEDDHVMRIPRNGLGKFPRWKQILTQLQGRDVWMMRFTREEIQHAFVVASFALGRTKQLLKIVDFGYAWVKMDPFDISCFRTAVATRRNNNDTVELYLLRRPRLWSRGLRSTVSNAALKSSSTRMVTCCQFIFNRISF